MVIREVALTVISCEWDEKSSNSIMGSVGSDNSPLLRAVITDD